jgi:glycosyltransferase involved in cell wall biosynthesis
MPNSTPPRVVVFSSLFPSAQAPTAGTFIRERMFRVAKQVPLVVIAPQAWSPFDGLVRLVRKSFRPMAAEVEVMDGVQVYRPRFFSMPGLFKRYDGWFMAHGASKVFKQVCREFKPTLVDAHFLFPDGYAASRLAKQAGLPLTITIRGSKDEWLIGTDREPFLKRALQAASHLIAVSDALKRDVAMRLGIEARKVTVIGNGVDLSKFQRVDRAQARAKLGLPDDAKVLISVGGLIERKGFHRIIPLLPALRQQWPTLRYLIVGGGTTQADMTDALKTLARQHGVDDIVQFCGAQVPAELKWYYGAADVFALATAHEGWANVFLEAMACGLPVITTQVGGNAEVVANPSLGTLVPFFDDNAFQQALHDALSRSWDRDAIVAYAQSNTWDQRIDQVQHVFRLVFKTA